MIVYAVELEMEAGLHDEYLTWLREHVGEMLQLPGFTGAEIMERRDPPPPGDRRTLVVHYRLTGLPAWNEYLERHAPRMRAAGAPFGARVRIARSLLQTLE